MGYEEFKSGDFDNHLCSQIDKLLNTADKEMSDDPVFSRIPQDGQET